MDVYDESPSLSKRDIIEIYTRWQRGKSVRFAKSVWWWNLSYRGKDERKKAS